MTEDIISFETAKLAKEKGFNEYCNYYYINQGLNLFININDKLEYIQGKQERLENVYQIDDVYLAPTQSLLQKWLREEHNIHIVVDYFGPDKIYFFTIYGHKKLEDPDCSPSYEVALEEGLQKALKLIQ